MSERSVISRYITKGEPYVRVKLSDGSVVREHRFVMEKRLGRPPEPHEHVHHVNEDKQDNRPDNLELITLSGHSALHSNPVSAVSLVCGQCNRPFERTPRYLRAKSKQGVTQFYCSNKCSRDGVLSRKIGGVTHGTSYAYNQKGCRCAPCREYKHMVQQK